MFLIYVSQYENLGFPGPHQMSDLFKAGVTPKRLEYLVEIEGLKASDVRGICYKEIQLFKDPKVWENYQNYRTKGLSPKEALAKLDGFSE